MKRLLRVEEIDSLFENFENLFPSSMNGEQRFKILKQIEDDLRQQISTCLVYPETLDEIRSQMRTIIQNAIIPPGESVGILCSQSIGERQTQLTLNSFHSSGLNVSTVTTGVPRFLEVLNATKEPKASINSFVLKNGEMNIRQVRQLLGPRLRSLYWADLYEHEQIEFNKTEEPWYEPFEYLYSCDFRFNNHCISYKLRKNILYEYNISLLDIKERIENKFDDIYVVVSPLSYAQVDIFLDVSVILEELQQNDKSFTENSLEDNLLFHTFIEDVIKPRLDEILICGIPKIKNYYIMKENMQSKHYKIEVEGNNMYELLKNPHIQPNTIKTNNMWEVYRMLGVEATRKFLLEELKSIVSSDGTFINPCHLLLLVNIMTFYGQIQSVSRYGVKKETDSVLAKATFEETLDHFSKAAFFSENETIRSVSSSIMCGKRTKIGSGMNDVVVDWQPFANYKN